MEQKKPTFFIGLDVHEGMTWYAVRAHTGELLLSGECATRYDDLFKALEPYLHSCRIGIESTTSYYHVYWGFKKKGYDIVVANTLRIRSLVATNDRIDAERLSDMLRLGSFPMSYVPDEQLMRLRTLVNLRQNFVEESNRFQNQVHSGLAKHGLKIYERTDFSKKWRAQLQMLMAAHPEIIEMRYAYEHLLVIESKIEAVEAEMIAFCTSHWSQEIELLDSIPGVAKVIACSLIADICPISRFASKKKLRRYAGIIPCTQESGGKVYGGHLPKTSSRGHLRLVLTQASWAAVKGKNRLSSYFDKKKKTRPKNRAIIAVASSLCDIVYNVLTSREPYKQAA